MPGRGGGGSLSGHFQILPQALLRFFAAGLRAAVFLAALRAGFRAAGFLAALFLALLRAAGFLAGPPSSRLRFRRDMRSTTLALGRSGLGAGSEEASSSPASARSSIIFIRSRR